MKTSMLNVGLLALLGLCLLNALINTGCISQSANGQDSFRLEGLERAAGEQYDTPVLY
jgi:hypothetical protein